MNLIQVTEKLGRVKADIGALKAEEESLKSMLISAAAADVRDAVVDGPLFRSTVSFADKRVVDYKAILAALVEEFRVSQKTIDRLTEKNTSVAPGVPCVRVTARKAA